MHWAPGIPHALFGRKVLQNSGAIRAAGSRIYVCVIAARYRTSLNIGSSVLAGSRLASFTSSAGLVISQTTHAMAIKAAAAITASALLVNSGGSMAGLVAEDHPVLVSCRIIGADQRKRNPRPTGRARNC